MINNTRNWQTSIISAILILFLGWGITSCKDELRTNKGLIPDSTTDEIEIEEGWFKVSMSFNAAEHLNPAKNLRTLTPAQENGIKDKSVRVLVFKSTGTGDIFDHEAKVTKIEPNVSDENASGKITLFIKDSAPASYKFVVLANVPLENPATTVFSGMSSDEVLALFTFKMPNDNTWKGDDLPMWGELSAVAIHSQGAVPSLGTVSLIRAVARIDIGLNMTTEGTEQFSEKASGITGISLTYAYFYNMNDKGYVAPTSTSYSSAEKKVTAPSAPTTGVTTIDFDKNSEIKNDLLLRSVYVPEATNANATTTDYMKRPCMVVGLKGTVKGNAEKVTYYRIDFLKREGAEPNATYEYLPLLRNYRYLVNITNVGGPGFDSPEEAKKGPAANIMYNVEAWEESTMSNVQYDGQYMLGVSDDDLTYYDRHETQYITVRTSWPGGWEAAVESTSSDWLKIDKSKGDSGSDVNLGISVTDNSADDATKREGIITITAGRMSWKVKVIQLNESKLSLGLFDEDGVTPISMVEFHAIGGEKTIVVKYQPSDGQYELKKVNGDEFAIEEIGDSNLISGERKYKITAKPMIDETDLFEVIDNFAQIKVTADDGRVLRQILTINQTEYNIIPYKNKVSNQLVNSLLEGENELYLMDGKDKKFYIKSNLPYKLELIENHPNEIYGGDKTELMINGFESKELLGKFSGEEITFTTYNDLTQDQQKRMYGTAKFKITSLAKDKKTGKPIVEKEFYVDLASGIIQPEANCYLMKPGKVGILIPVSRVNSAKKFYDGYADQMRDNPSSYALGRADWDNKIAFPSLGETEEWVAELVWSDMESDEILPARPIKPDGTAGFRIIKKVGIGQNAYIYILPGKTKIGNAIVRCREAKKSGNTLWSWHIWVVDEYPMLKHINNPNSNNLVLDRNVGANKVATSYIDTTKESYGMQYQFGRKDPFPIPNDNGYKRLVDKNGDEFTIYQGAGYVTMKETIMNPNEITSNNNNWMYEVGRINRKLRVWYEVWGGIEDNTKEQNGAWTKALETRKSIFDPSPYGWKIPAMGLESNWKTNIETGKLILPLSGYFENGEISKFQENITYYGLSTVHSSDIAPRAIKLGPDGKAASLELDKKFNRSGTVVIRSIYNPEESDYKKYLP
ncbi:BACON domain-containing carbohydrate-binding protein [Porphyromonadaceae bacterium W3.11]|nr:BACON domain-containing carbohydrate-binding protein [Porphyromonadaceae bacterium W3.11]